MATSKTQATDDADRNQLIIPLAALKAVRQFSAKQDVRFYLLGLQIEIKDNMVSMVATNGHTLAYWQDNTVVEDTTIYLPNEMADLLIKHSPRSGVVFTKDDLGNWSTSVGDGYAAIGFTVAIRKPEFAYPAWRRVLDPDAPEVTADVIFDVGYMNLMMKVGKILGEKQPRLIIRGEKRTAQFRFDCMTIEGTFKALVMPMSI